MKTVLLALTLDMSSKIVIETTNAKKCNVKHNVSICTFSNNQGDRFNSDDEKSENSSSNNLANNSGGILLQTAYIKVSNLCTQ